MRIRTTRDIEPGEELFIPYGPDYWRQERQLARDAKTAALARKARGRRKVNASSAEVIEQPAGLGEDECTAAGTSAGPTEPQHSTHAPISYAQARTSGEWESWRGAMLSEENSLHAKGVFTIVKELPKGFKTLDTKWVFAYKRDAEGKVIRYKARLVVRGFMQREGIDYDLTYAPVMQSSSFKVALGIAAVNDLECKIMDVETAFLNAPLHEEVYVRVPAGFEGAEQGCFLRLNRALYGLKQAGREWNHTLAQALRDCGYTACENSDRCVFTRRTRSGRPLYIGTYVDDMPYIYDKRDEAEMESDKRTLMQRFSIKDLGNISNALGMRIRRDRAARTLTIDLAPYLERVLKEFGYDACRRTEPTPESTGMLTADTRMATVTEPELGSGGAERAGDADADSRSVTVSNYAQAIVLHNITRCAVTQSH